jgi:hypothetical protein
MQGASSRWVLIELIEGARYDGLNSRCFGSFYNVIRPISLGLPELMHCKISSRLLTLLVLARSATSIFFLKYQGHEDTYPWHHNALILMPPASPKIHNVLTSCYSNHGNPFGNN